MRDDKTLTFGTGSSGLDCTGWNGETGDKAKTEPLKSGTCERPVFVAQKPAAARSATALS